MFSGIVHFKFITNSLQNTTLVSMFSGAMIIPQKFIFWQFPDILKNRFMFIRVK